MNSSDTPSDIPPTTLSDVSGEPPAGSAGETLRSADGEIAGDATVALLRALVRRASVTPEDGGCQTLIGERLAGIGFALESMPSNGVTNLWARRGTEAPLLVLAGHTDVVPSGTPASWRMPPFAAEIVDGQVVGRGAADMKGGVAAMVTACERFVARGGHRRGSIAFLLTSDEEGPATDGTAHVVRTLRARDERIDLCLVGEPSSRERLGDTIRHGRRGSLGATLRVRGVQGHVAYPHLADNPVHRAAAFLAELVRIEWDRGDEHFPPTTLQVSNIAAGTGATNVIPAECTIDFNLRYGTASPAGSLKARILALVEKHALDVSLEWRDSARPFITEPGTLTEALREAIRETLGVEAALDTGGGTSDGRFIAPGGAQVVEFGPINATIHQIDERVDAADIVSLSCIYENLLERLLGRTPGDDGEGS